MPSARSPNPRAGSNPPDDLDRLLDYDNAVEEFLRDIPVDDGGQHNAASTANEQARDEDQEVQIKKKRRPVPKLDENLLLSRNGISKLRKIANTRLEFRGKGHEFSDVSRLLNTYQLWLDDLYPRAKFKDALTMVEKVGHSKRMQVMRKAWLDETKPHRQGLSPDVEMSGANGTEEDPNDLQNRDISGDDTVFNNMNSTHSAAAAAANQLAMSDEVPEEDEPDILSAEGQKAEQVQRKCRAPFDEAETDEDELDALIAENEPEISKQRGRRPPPPGPFGDEPGEDELDALMAEQFGVVPNVKLSTERDALSREDRADDFADDEEAMASMGW